MGCTLKHLVPIYTFAANHQLQKKKKIQIAKKYYVLEISSSKTKHIYII